MRWIRKFVDKEAITYWNPSGINRFARRTFSNPVTISGRWEEVCQEFFTPEGENLFSRSMIYTTAEVSQGGYLLRGSSSSSDPTTVSGAYPIQRIDRWDDLRYKHRIIKVFL